ncbi:MAG: hypothetical protein IJ863_00930 [Spirochaetales bacterium]|nr:hypothetical protein [Spirochaetales bacterium]
MVTVIVLVALLIVLGAIQTQLHLRRVRRVPVRILVNGTRGKTTVTRMLASALKASGMTVVAKTTGSEAAFVLPDGEIRAVNRTFGPSILRESIQVFRLASRHGADAVVMECMAVRPENQILISSMVRPTVSIITNARIDHVDAMGDSIESTCRVLRLSVPTGSRFYTSDQCFSDDGDAVIVDFGDSPNERNRALVLQVLKDMGVDLEAAEPGIDAYVPDMGLVGPFMVNGHRVINAFAANDRQSAEEILRSVGDLSEVTVVYNNRADREFRLRFFSDVFSAFNCPNVIVVGDHIRKCSRYIFRKAPGCRVVPFRGSEEELLAQCGATVVCMGNIKGSGISLIQYCQSCGEEV